ncbi:sortase [Candidatus Shapirobacteria bacterium]|nr:sortase [Candidatus Shapirobacteria bacterium]
MSYIYVKTLPKPHREKKRLSPQHKKIFASIFLFSGLILFFSVLFPILQFQIEYATKFNQVLNPLSSQYYNRSGSVLGDLSSSDYTQLSSWFVSDTGSTVLSSLPESYSGNYFLSIPSLKIDKATVIVGSSDLKKSLIQYPQTALPGQLGSPVIFGHSVLPQFFNPKSYLTIFSTLYKLKPGDDIIIDYDHIRYRYIIEEMFEVQPTDLSVLEQRFDGRYLTVITCSPPGTYLRRLVIKARITDL